MKLLFFNKTDSDIMWKDQLSALASENNRYVLLLVLEGELFILVVKILTGLSNIFK